MLEQKVYKNYKELCEDMGWENIGGNTKVKHLNIISEKSHSLQLMGSSHELLRDYTKEELKDKLDKKRLTNN